MISVFWYESSPNYFWKDWNNHVDGLLRNTSRYCIVASEVPLLCLRSFRRLLICEAQKQITFWETLLSFAWVNSVFKLNIHVLPVLHNSTYICTQSITLAYINGFFFNQIGCPLPAPMICLLGWNDQLYILLCLNQRRGMSIDFKCHSNPNICTFATSDIQCMLIAKCIYGDSK